MITLKKNKYFMIDETGLSRLESKEFISCLEVEKFRHVNAKNNCLIKFQQSYSFLNLMFWFSSYKRHLQDIEMIDKSIKYLKLKWKINV